MLSYGDDASYASRNLRGTSVLKGNKLVYIDSIHSGGAVWYYDATNGDLGEGGVHSCDLSELNIDACKLGYVNYARTCDYYMRVPKRQWRQGFDENNVQTKSGGRALVTSKYFEQTVLGNYPTYHDVLKELNSEEVFVRSRAFSRQFAFYREAQCCIKLMHQGTAIGDYIDGGFRLYPVRKYLKEKLERAISENI